MKAPKKVKGQSLFKKASRQIYSNYDDAMKAAKEVGGIVGLVGPDQVGALKNDKEGFIVVRKGK